jgi:hypothetical protein
VRQVSAKGSLGSAGGAELVPDGDIQMFVAWVLVASTANTIDSNQTTRMAAVLIGKRD